MNSNTSMKLKENGRFPLPIAPSDLCFERHEFLESSFSVDSFLHVHKKKANLETIRDDLGVYLKVLRSAMIELINKDYADFVNLSSNLIGLDKAIHSIQVPLGQLKEEVMQVKQTLDDSMTDLSDQLNQRRSIHFKKRTLSCTSTVKNILQKLGNLLNNAEKPLASDVIERTASEYNRLQFVLSNSDSHETEGVVEEAEKICNILTSSLNSKFLESVKTKNMSEMAHCLRVYIILDRISYAEELLRKEIIAMALTDIICDNFLNSNPSGLQGVYSHIINFIEQDMKLILEVTSGKSCQVREFDFLVNSLWPEVEQRLEINLSSIFAPGNPEMFYKRYCETMEFLEKLNGYFDSAEHITKLHCHPQYKAFLEHWNLPVYFQIRFQEIAGSFETVASDVKSTDILDSSSEFRVFLTSVLWNCLLQCWGEGVFLNKLGHRFWKLSLQLLARYSVWIKEFLQEASPLLVSNNINSSSQIIMKSNKRNQLLVLLYLDLQNISSKIPFLEEKTLQKLHGISEQNQNLIKKSFEDSKLQILDNLPMVSQAIVNSICEESLVHLRQVSDIPRLFRRTNRETPTKPCTYVSQVLSPSMSFMKKHEDRVDIQLLLQWLTKSFSTLTEHYWNAVSDVLTSVQKTEESLRRLKKLRDKTSASTVESRGSDDDKIRRQLVIDVESYCAGVLEIGVTKEDVNKLKDLVTLVNQASQIVDSK